MPQLIIIVAMTREQLIGCANRIPWHLPEDLKVFKRLTSDHTVIMGRRTWLSIGRPLPRRRNLVVSRTLSAAPGCEIYPDLPAALAAASHAEKIFIIGGSQLYAEALPCADQLYISWVDGVYSGDTWFPAFNLNDWQQLEQTSYPGFSLCHYRRC